MSNFSLTTLSNIELNAIPPCELDRAIGNAFAPEQNDIVQVNIVETQKTLHCGEISDIEMEKMFDVLLGRINGRLNWLEKSSSRARDSPLTHVTPVGT